jgi:hypothetical protein
MEEIANDLGMQKSSATVKASQLRQKGIKLPKLAQSRQKLDLGVLARMVQDYEADLDGNANVTISDHMGDDVQDEDNTEFVGFPEQEV